MVDASVVDDDVVLLLLERCAVAKPNKLLPATAVGGTAAAQLLQLAPVEDGRAIEYPSTDTNQGCWCVIDRFLTR